MYKVGDKVRIVDVDKIFFGFYYFKNGDETIIGHNKRFDAIGLVVPNSLGSVMLLIEDEFDGIEKVEN